MNPSARYCVSALILLAALITLAVSGCKKTELPPPTAVTVPFSPQDLNADGTLNAKATAALDAKAGEKALIVAFYRSNLSDAGLAQLGKYKNIQRVDAVGSALTPAGIAKLKESLPQVEVMYR